MYVEILIVLLYHLSMEKIGFLGAGNMAFAIAKSIENGRRDCCIMPFDVSDERMRLFEESFCNVKPAFMVEDLLGCDVLFLAVKPQCMKVAIEPLVNFDGLVISIAAGLKISFFESELPKARVIRVMPNTPCLVGAMAAGFSRGCRVNGDDVRKAKELLDYAGLSIEVEELELDVVTGLSGSGPAFFARLAEAFIEAGEKFGLCSESARMLGLQTMKGTAELLLKRDMSTDDLVRMVSSPNGTTVSGRAVLEASCYKEIIADTIGAAIGRSRELGK